MVDLNYNPSMHVPYRSVGKLELDRIAAIKSEDMDKPPGWAHPDFNINIVDGSEIERLCLEDMFTRIRMSSEDGSRCVLIIPQPWPTLYNELARRLNREGINCRNLWTFDMDDYANEFGHVMPESDVRSFLRCMKVNFYGELDERLRPPESQILGPTTKNIDHYSQLILDASKGEGASACYSGPGVTGHLAFIEPDAPEFQVATDEEWEKMGSRICTLSPFTIMQNSMSGPFGRSGALHMVPPRAATIGPRDVIASQYRFDMHSITVGGATGANTVSWQRFTTRLCLHGPITRFVPQSILQKYGADVYVSHEAAENIECRIDLGY